MNHEAFLRRAIELALESDPKTGDAPYGTVIVKDGRIVGEGRNRVATSHDPTAHSEIEAIRDACRRLGTHSLEGCLMYTSGEPCPMCSGAIVWAKVSRIYYGASRADCVALGLASDAIVEEVSKPIEKRSIPAERLCTEETIQALRTWLTRARG